MTGAAPKNEPLRLSPVALAVAQACRGLLRPRAVVPALVYVRAGGPFGAHRKPVRRA